MNIYNYQLFIIPFYFMKIIKKNYKTLFFTELLYCLKEPLSSYIYIYNLNIYIIYIFLFWWNPIFQSPVLLTCTLLTFSYICKLVIPLFSLEFWILGFLVSFLCTWTLNLNLTMFLCVSSLYIRNFKRYLKWPYMQTWQYPIYIGTL